MAVLISGAMLLSSACTDNGAQVPVASDVQQTTSAEATESSTSSSVAASDTSAVESTSSTELTSASSVADTTVSQSTATTSSEPQDVPDDQTLSVTCTIPNSWQEGGMECTQIDVVVRNISDSDIEGWTIDMTLGQEHEVMQYWNTEVKPNGTVLSCTNVGYNALIPTNGEITYGVIVKSASPINDITCSAGGSKLLTTQENTKPVQTAASTAAPSAPQIAPPEKTGRYGLVSECGQLSVKGADLVDKNGDPVQLRGISTHGIQWFPAFANKSVFKHLRDEWNVNVIRLAMYTGAGEGYTDSTKAGIEKTVQDAVDACIELDLYVIIDWHVLQDQSPQVRKADSLRFFEYMSKKYADHPNVIYEICNEPNGYASWEGDVKPYAEEVIPVIRANDPDSIVIVGTPTWSQDIDKALASPLGFDNVMYALHYYAATHTDWLRDRLKSCYSNGLPVFVSEFGNCDASGNGQNNWDQAKKWFELMDSLNISYVNWSLADKAEAASLLKPGASTTGGWSDNELTENGKFMKSWLRDHQ